MNRQIDAALTQGGEYVWFEWEDWALCAGG